MVDKSVPSSVPGAGGKHLDMHAKRATCLPAGVAPHPMPGAAVAPDMPTGPMPDNDSTGDTTY
jgi:hypothetical protein